MITLAGSEEGCYVSDRPGIALSWIGGLSNIRTGRPNEAARTKNREGANVQRDGEGEQIQRALKVTEKKSIEPFRL